MEHQQHPPSPSPPPSPPSSQSPQSPLSQSPPQFDLDLQSELAAIIGATISGAKYGIRIRLPHAAVMTFLFRGGMSNRDKLKVVLKATYEHSYNLASFAALYKTILFLLKWASIRLRDLSFEHRNSRLHQIGTIICSLIVDGSSYRGRRLQNRPAGIPEKTRHAAIAGAVGGYYIWGKYTSINHQIVLYLTSRILLGLTTLAQENHVPPFDWKFMTKREYTYPIKAAIVWGVVMVLFEEYPHVLHRSLKKSMDEIYRMNIFSNGQKKVK